MSRAKKDPRLVTRQEPNSIVTEAYRTIRTFIRYGAAEQGRKTILFTSPSAGDGKTSLVTNLGYLIAQEGLKTLLIDGDLRRPNLHHIFRLANRNGLSSFLSGYTSFDEIAQPTDIPDLSLIPAGPIQPSPSELLGNFRMSQLLEFARSAFDLILIDSPPILRVSDPAVLARSADGLIVIVRTNKTKRDDIVKTQLLLEPFKSKVLGFVLNDKPES